MKKANVLSRLNTHFTRGESQVRGELCFAEFFHWWLNRLTIPADMKYNFYDIDPYLVQLAVDAWEAMRTGTGTTEKEFRKRCEEELNGPMVSPTDIRGNLLDQLSCITIISYVLSSITDGDWIRNETEKYCRAQIITLQGLFDKFIRTVYRKGLFEVIQAENRRGMKGLFGSTELRTFVMAGRTMFTFARPKKKGAEVSVSFVAGDDDDLALEAGVNSVEANLPTAFNMIEDVITRWPKTRAEQKRIFKSDDKIAPLAVHVVRAQAKAKA